MGAPFLAVFARSGAFCWWIEKPPRLAQNARHGAPAKDKLPCTGRVHCGSPHRQPRETVYYANGRIFAVCAETVCDDEKVAVDPKAESAGCPISRGVCEKWGFLVMGPALSPTPPPTTPWV